jgi:hypothetical protein
MNQDSDETTASEPDAAGGPGHRADRPATDKEAAAADEQLAKETDAERADVAKHEKEMMELGANVKGEGAID